MCRDHVLAVDRNHVRDDDGRWVTVADSFSFVPEDQPAELARLIVDFAA